MICSDELVRKFIYIFIYFSNFQLQFELNIVPMRSLNEEKKLNLLQFGGGWSVLWWIAVLGAGKWFFFYLWWVIICCLCHACL